MIRSYFTPSTKTKLNIVDLAFALSVLALFAQLTCFAVTGRMSAWGVAVTASIITLLD
jgi:hypothetical protein